MKQTKNNVTIFKISVNNNTFNFGNSKIYIVIILLLIILVSNHSDSYLLAKELFQLICNK